MTILIFDTETTDATDDPQIIQVGAILIEPSDDNTIDLSPPLGEWNQTYKPTKRINHGALATHHILPQDLIGSPPSSTFVLPQTDYLIGHKVDFDWEVAGSPNVKRICTLAIAKWLWPEADAHTLSALLYMLTPENQWPQMRKALRNAHSALQDCWLCLELLQHELKAAKEHAVIDTWEDLWEFSEHCRIPTIVSFGKHKGTPINKLPTDYISWLLKQQDLDPYLRIALTTKKAMS